MCKLIKKMIQKTQTINTKLTPEQFKKINEYCEKYGYAKSQLFRTTILRIIEDLENKK